jgi:membrane-anchored protein YejM (alkaline phosphatase superfamily)
MPPLPWFTESYFSRDPATAKARKIYIIILIVGCSVIIVFALAVLSIYWGSLWKTATLVHHLNGWVVVSLASSLLTFCAPRG